MTTDPEIRRLIQELVEKIKREYQPEKIILFGSYAYGEPDEDSDLDFLIIKQTSDRFIDRNLSVSQIVSDPELLIPVEPLVFTPREIEEALGMGDQFIEEILERGAVLYDR